MKTARLIFLLSGLYGLAVMGLMPFAPQWMKTSASATTDPLFYYGYISVTAAWQLVFLLIAINPVRYRPLMLLAALTEKFGFVCVVAALLLTDQVSKQWAFPMTIDAVLGFAFIWAFWKSRGVKNQPRL